MVKHTQFVGNSRRIVVVCLTFLVGLALKGLIFSIKPLLIITYVYYYWMNTYFRLAVQRNAYVHQRPVFETDAAEDCRLTCKIDLNANYQLWHDRSAKWIDASSKWFLSDIWLITVAHSQFDLRLTGSLFTRFCPGTWLRAYMWDSNRELKPCDTSSFC